MKTQINELTTTPPDNCIPYNLPPPSWQTTYKCNSAQYIIQLTILMLILWLICIIILVIAVLFIVVGVFLVIYQENVGMSVCEMRIVYQSWKDTWQNCFNFCKNIISIGESHSSVNVVHLSAVIEVLLNRTDAFLFGAIYRNVIQQEPFCKVCEVVGKSELVEEGSQSVSVRLHYWLTSALPGWIWYTFSTFYLQFVIWNPLCKFPNKTLIFAIDRHRSKFRMCD